MDASTRYIRRETAISAVINGAISVGFFIAVFGLDGPVIVQGVGNYAFDFLPQSFAIGLFASLVPGALLCKAINSGQFAEHSNTLSGKRIVLLSLGSAVVCLLIGAVFGAGLDLSGLETAPLWLALILKTLYGMALGSLVTLRLLSTELGRLSPRDSALG